MRMYRTYMKLWIQFSHRRLLARENMPDSCMHMHAAREEFPARLEMYGAVGARV
jgi:hypothetical protein